MYTTENYLYEFFFFLNTRFSIRFLKMFVRLFVDENLDRMVPISRQPREKIQAIIGKQQFKRNHFSLF